MYVLSRESNRYDILRQTDENPSAVFETNLGSVRLKETYIQQVPFHYV